MLPSVPCHWEKFNELLQSVATNHDASDNSALKFSKIVLHAVYIHNLTIFRSAPIAGAHAFVHTRNTS